jgi:hypothetical protein
VLDGLRVRREGTTRLPVRALSLEQLEIAEHTECQPVVAIAVLGRFPPA